MKRAAFATFHYISMLQRHGNIGTSGKNLSHGYPAMTSATGRLDPESWHWNSKYISGLGDSYEKIRKSTWTSGYPSPTLCSDTRQPLSRGHIRRIRTVVADAGALGASLAPPSTPGGSSDRPAGSDFNSGHPRGQIYEKRPAGSS